MCKKWVEEHFGELPSGWMNLILILFSIPIIILIYYEYPKVNYDLIQTLAIILGTIVVGNSITHLRSKTVQNELIRSDIDTINHCITNKKLKIETYYSALIANNAAGNDNNKKLAKIGEAKIEADNALGEYIDFCKKLKANGESSDIVNETFEKCLENLKEQIHEGKNK